MVLPRSTVAEADVGVCPELLATAVTESGPGEEE